MFLVGVLADKKTQKMLEQNRKDIEIIPVSTENMKNMKNVTFDTIIIDEKIEDMQKIEPFIKKSEYIVLNSDRKNTIPKVESKKTALITYGFNSKSTVTASSIMEEEILICLQRNVKSKNGEILEPQEFWVKANQSSDVYEIMAETCMNMIYGKTKAEKI